MGSRSAATADAPARARRRPAAAALGRAPGTSTTTTAGNPLVSPGSWKSQPTTVQRAPLKSPHSGWRFDASFISAPIASSSWSGIRFAIPARGWLEVGGRGVRAAGSLATRQHANVGLLRACRGNSCSTPFAGGRRREGQARVSRSSTSRQRERPRQKQRKLALAEAKANSARAKACAATAREGRGQRKILPSHSPPTPAPRQGHLAHPAPRPPAPRPPAPHDPHPADVPVTMREEEVSRARRMVQREPPGASKVSREQTSGADAQSAITVLTFLSPRAGPIIHPPLHTSNAIRALSNRREAQTVCPSTGDQNDHFSSKHPFVKAVLGGAGENRN